MRIGPFIPIKTTLAQAVENCAMLKLDAEIRACRETLERNKTKYKRKK